MEKKRNDGIASFSGPSPPAPLHSPPRHHVLNSPNPNSLLSKPTRHTAAAVFSFPLPLPSLPKQYTGGSISVVTVQSFSPQPCATATCSPTCSWSSQTPSDQSLCRLFHLQDESPGHIAVHAQGWWRSCASPLLPAIDVGG